MTNFILTIVISALAGGACGYLLARHIWQDRLLEMEQKRQEIRRKRLELHRERFQESTSRIHRPTAVASEASVASSEELEQLHLEMTLLREDHRVEKEILQREIMELKGEDRSDSDFEDTEAVFVEVESDGAEAVTVAAENVEPIEDVTPQYDDEQESDSKSSAVGIAAAVAGAAAIGAVVGSKMQEEGPDEEASEPILDEEPVLEAEPVSEEPAAVEQEAETPTELVAEGHPAEPVAEEQPVQAEPAAEDQPAEAEQNSEEPQIAESEYAPPFIPSSEEDAPSGISDVSPTTSGEEPADHTAEPAAERSSLIAPVPTDIESLFRAPRVEEPAVNPEATTQPEEPILESAAEELEEAQETEQASLEAETTQDIAGDDLTDDIEAAPFAIHWNADRPGLHKELSPVEESATDSPDESEASEEPSAEADEDARTEPAIPVFRSLHDMLAASGVSPASAESEPLKPSESESPTWTPQSETPAANAATDKALIRSIVSLDAESFSLLDELGYASLTRLAQLSPSEIRRLAQVFRINPDQIEQDWKPTATAHLNMQANQG